MPGLDDKTRVAIRRIPSMGTHNVGDYLYDVCRQTTGQGEVVEVGTWLGASAAWMAAGLRDTSHDPTLHCFDRFWAMPPEVFKAKRNGGVELFAGEQTRRKVECNLLPIYENIELHKGDIRTCKWDGSPIEVYADDAAKNDAAFRHVLRTFGPSFIPGVTTVLLHDIARWRKGLGGSAHDQRKIMASLSDHFEVTYDAWPKTSLVAFRYTRRCDFAERLEAA